MNFGQKRHQVDYAGDLCSDRVKYNFKLPFTKLAAHFLLLIETHSVGRPFEALAVLEGVCILKLISLATTL